MRETERIGICGGTFDPFHRGHVDPIVGIRAELGWDRLIYVPARRQPFKQGRAMSSAYHRFAMAALALQDVEMCELSPVELERDGLSYTVDTLGEMRRMWPDATVDWIIGDDNLALLPEWKAIERLFELTNFVVLSRNPAAAVVPEVLADRIVAAADRRRAGGIVLAHNREIIVSSTDIRRRVRDGESIDGLVEDRVARYIGRHGLYRSQELTW